MQPIEEEKKGTTSATTATSAELVPNAEFEIINQTLLIGKICLNGANESTKIAAFDMDWTLIKTKTGRTFPNNEHDWQMWHDKVPSKLRRLVADGFRIVVFTNQGGVASGKRTVN